MSEEIAGQAPEALEPFAESRALTLGVELELQIVNTRLRPHFRSADLLR
jgi:hypothetical protein